MQMNDSFKSNLNKGVVVGDTFAHSIARFIVAISVTIIGWFSHPAANEAKRLLFISSVYTELVREGVLNQITHEQLNDTFGLANDSASLEAGGLIGQTVWRESDFKMALSNSVSNNQGDKAYNGIVNLDNFIRYLIESTPPWIRYNEKHMVEDIKRLFETQPMMLPVGA